MKYQLASRFRIALPFAVALSLLFSITAPLPIASATPFTVTYDGNGNTGGSAPIDSSAYASGARVSVSDRGDLVKTGYRFGGWAMSGGLNPAVVYQEQQGEFIISNNTTLAAVWNLDGTYTIYYYGNGNTGGLVPSPTVGSGMVQLAFNSGNLVKSGSIFMGWSSSPSIAKSVNQLPGTAFSLERDRMLYAWWKLVQCGFTITYLGNGKTSGSVPHPTTGCGMVTLRTNSGNLKKLGVTATKWNTKANGLGVNRGFGTTYNLTNNLTLFAKWN